MNIKKLYIIVVSLLVAGCTIVKPNRKLSKIYGKVIKQELAEQNPVIVIPGILGSKLVHDSTETIVWGAYTPGTLSPRKARGAKYFALPMGNGIPLHKLKDEIRPAGALESLKVSILPGLSVSPKAYAQMLSVLGAGGYIDETIKKAGGYVNKTIKKSHAHKHGPLDYGDFHFSCFQFDYDWRRSNVENAARLAKFIQQKKVQVRRARMKKHGRSGPVKFNIVAHSMGGLLARYYLRYGSQPLPQAGLPKLNWAGAKDIDKVVLVGSPHLGSPQALIQLCEGFQVAPLLTPKYSSTLIGTMPSVYELLPRARHQLVRAKGKNVDLLNLEVWKKYQWGLAQTDNDADLKMILPSNTTKAQRHDIALNHLKKCLNNAKKFHRALDRRSVPPKHLKIVAWVGDSGKTTTFLAAEQGGVKEIGKGAGDETVPRFSAVADERGPDPSKGRFTTPVYWGDINYIYKDHLGMTKDVNFSDNLLAFLLNQGSGFEN